MQNQLIHLIITKLACQVKKQAKYFNRVPPQETISGIRSLKGNVWILNIKISWNWQPNMAGHLSLRLPKSKMILDVDTPSNPESA
jgi:hypothetical protein